MDRQQITLSFIKLLNTKHPSIKFEYKIKNSHFQIRKYVLKTKDYTPNYLERKQTTKLY